VRHHSLVITSGKSGWLETGKGKGKVGKERGSVWTWARGVLSKTPKTPKAGQDPGQCMLAFAFLGTGVDGLQLPWLQPH